MRVADHECDRHGFAQRPAQGQHGAAENAGARVGDHHLPHHFPGGAAKAVSGLLQHGRHGEENVARHRRDEGQDHDGKDQARRESADAIGGAAQQCAQHGDIGDGFNDGFLQVQLKPGREHEQAPDAVNDGRNAGQQFDGDADGAAQPARAKLGQEDGDADAHRQGHQHGQERGYQGADNGGEGAEFFGRRLPGFRPEEGGTEFLDGRQRTQGQRDHHAHEQHQHEQGGQEGQPPEQRFPAGGSTHGPGFFGGIIGQGDIGH